MNEKTRFSSEKEKVKESQSRSVASPLDIHFGCRVGGVTKPMKMCLKYRLLFTISCFREPDEKKIEVEDEKGRK